MAVLPIKTGTLLILNLALKPATSVLIDCGRWNLLLTFLHLGFCTYSTESPDSSGLSLISNEAKKLPISSGGQSFSAIVFVRILRWHQTIFGEKVIIGIRELCESINSVELHILT